MKKSLFTLAALAAVMASCSNENILVDNNQKQNANETAIGFETFTSKATRADNSSETTQLGLEDHHTTFSVWGYKDVQTALVFGTSATEGQKVVFGKASETATTNSWNYTPMRFWDKNSNTYDFYAAAPETTSAPQWTLNANTNAQNDDYFTLDDVTIESSSLASTTYVESMRNQSNKDYMIAGHRRIALANYGQVQLNFNHILSRLNITVKKGTSLDGLGNAGKLAITGLTVYNMSAKGSFAENGVTDAATLAAGTTARWTPASAAVLKDYSGNTLADVPTTATYIMQQLVMPQTIGYNATVTKDGKWDADADASTANVALTTAAAPYIKIVYTIGETNPETFTAYYNLAALFNATSGLKFSEGWQNTLNITIDSNAITFKPQVYNWEDTTTSGSLNIAN